MTTSKIRVTRNNSGTISASLQIFPRRRAVITVDDAESALREFSIQLRREVYVDLCDEIDPDGYTVNTDDED